MSDTDKKSNTWIEDYINTHTPDQAREASKVRNETLDADANRAKKRRIDDLELDKQVRMTELELIEKDPAIKHMHSMEMKINNISRICLVVGILCSICTFVCYMIDRPVSVTMIIISILLIIGPILLMLFNPISWRMMKAEQARLRAEEIDRLGKSMIRYAFSGLTDLTTSILDKLASIGIILKDVVKEGLKLAQTPAPAVQDQKLIPDQAQTTKESNKELNQIVGNKKVVSEPEHEPVPVLKSTGKNVK